MDLLTTLTHLLTVSVLLLVDILRFWALSARSGASLRAENLFLRKQLALYKERKIKPRRASDSTRLVLVLLSRLFDWKGALLFVKPETLIGWHRKGFRLFWRWKSKQRGRPRLPMEIRALIRQMAKENITWGEERIAAELLLKLGIHVSARTVRRYMPHIPGTWEKSEQWTTFIKNHAQGILACDFFVTVTANFRLLYVFVIMEIGTRRIVHINVTDHPTSGWTLQQFREVIQESGAKRFLIHDRDCIYSKDLDAGIGSMGLTILKTPVRAPTANAYCERLIGTIRRECLDFMIPLNERHLRRILLEWVAHYNKGRPHSSLGPGIQDSSVVVKHTGASRHRIPDNQRVISKPILGGLHHEYRIEKIAA
jgi:transposase InsO family protein